jgi:hypothetical protein
MAYRLFFTDVPGVTKAQYEAQKSRLTVYHYHERDDALGMASVILARRGVVWEIESDDGSPMDRDQIQAELLARRSELAGRPKVR